ncbi:MAG: hypothetical protein M3044_08020 [Thermoproteota archaeon]|nr:hypothetical protein [Thermoproteota archaeon]
MNHSKTTLAIASIVAAIALTGVAFAMPQQALASYGHNHNHNHHNHNHNHNSNSIKVDQQANQQNFCVSGAQCLNNGTNTVDIHR